jgi:general bacterial porin, GBP family
MRAAIVSLGLYSAGAAAQQNGVTLYGIIDLGIEYDRVRQEAFSGGLPQGLINQSFLGVANGVQSGSRFGFRGNEDLGGGFDVNFVLEGGFNPAQGISGQGGRLFGRQSTLGITRRDVGRLDVGRQINLASNYFLSIDPFQEGFGQANIGSSFGSTNTARYGNMLLLQLTPLSGLKVGAGYSFSTGLSAIYAGERVCISTLSCPEIPGGYNFISTQNMRAITLGAQYNRGPIDVVVTYDKIYGDASQPNSSVSPSFWVLGGAYNFKVLKLSLAAGQSLNGFSNGQVQGTGATSSSVLTSTSLAPGVMLFLPGARANSYLVGVTAPLTSQFTLLASWQMMQPQGILTSDSQFKVQQILSAALTQQLSVRTNLYTYASYGQNFAMIHTAESFVFGVGIRHQF